MQRLPLLTLLLRIVHGEDPEGRFVFPSTCNRIESDQRLIADFSFPALRRNGGLVVTQVFSILRHGARSPVVEPTRCWPNYSSQWDCLVQETVQGHVQQPQPRSDGDRRRLLPDVIHFLQKMYPSGNDWNLRNPARVDENILLADAQQTPHKPRPDEEILQLAPPKSRDTLVFRKVIDHSQHTSVFKGSCGVGFLLYEGMVQHRLLGSLFAKAYPTLLDQKDFVNGLYVRASNMQRTLLSASVFVTAYLLESGNAGPEEHPDLLIHTRDRELESLYPNFLPCPGLISLKERVLASNEYQQLVKDHEQLRNRLQTALELPDPPEDLTENLADCLITSVCSAQIDSLPPGIRPSATFASKSLNGQILEKSLLNETLEAVDAISGLRYNWKGGTFSRVAIIRFMCDIKAKIIQGLLRDLSAVLTGSLLTRRVKEICNCDPQEFLDYSPEASPNNHKILLYFGHDTTIMPFLASLSLHDGKLPPYAAQIVLEISKSPMQVFYFRLIYDGNIITDKLEGCDKATDVCELTRFFAASDWAKPSNVQSVCGDSQETTEEFSW